MLQETIITVIQVVVRVHDNVGCLIDVIAVPEQPKLWMVHQCGIAIFTEYVLRYASNPQSLGVIEHVANMEYVTVDDEDFWKRSFIGWMCVLKLNIAGNLGAKGGNGGRLPRSHDVHGSDVRGEGDLAFVFRVH